MLSMALGNLAAQMLTEQNLLADNRGGARTGFPQPVAEELLLIAVARATYSD